MLQLIAQKQLINIMFMCVFDWHFTDRCVDCIKLMRVIFFLDFEKLPLVTTQSFTELFSQAE